MSQNSGPAAPGRTSTGAAAAAQAQAAAQDPSSASVGELVGLISKDFSTLMRQELDLAKAEVKQEAIKSGKAAGMFGAAGFAAGYMVLLFASIAAWWGLANVMDESWAALIVTGVWAVIGVVAFFARRQAQQIHPTPELTVETVREIPDALKGQAGSSA